MGNYIYRNRTNRVEEVGSHSSNNAYFYPPKSGFYFASHFIMGGERFETCQPETYLFGENMDLNFLGSKPTPFPYCAPLPHVPTRTLRALVNIRKETLKLVKVNLKEKTNKENLLESDQNLYNIEFTFDSDVKCSIKIYCMCLEEIKSSGLVYTSKDDSHNSPYFFYNKGTNQLFSQALYFFNPSLYKEEDLAYPAFNEYKNFDPTVPFPIVIHCIAEEGEEPRQSHSLIAVVEKNHDSCSIKPFKQKIFIDGLSYLMQEIYGIENKNLKSSAKKNQHFPCSDDEIEDNGSECVICMCDCRDTLILPCRHLCLCNNCADSLRYQANNCPICRAPFRALLQIKAVRKCSSNQLPNLTRITSTPPAIPHHQHSIHQAHQLLSRSACDLMDIPPGYEPIPLLEALNGTSTTLPNSARGMFSFRNSVEDESDSDTPLSVKKFDSKLPLALNSVQYESEIEIKENSPNERWIQSKYSDSNNCENKSNESSLSSNDSSITADSNTLTQEKIKLLAQVQEADKDKKKIIIKENKQKQLSKKNETKMIALCSFPSETKLIKSTTSEPFSNSSCLIMNLEDRGVDQQRMVDPDILPLTISCSAPNIVSRIKDLKIDKPKSMEENNLSKKAA